MSEAKSQGEKVIGLWLDGMSDPDVPAWIVSRDLLNDLGARETTPVRCFGPDEYAAAAAYARELADAESLRLVQ